MKTSEHEALDGGSQSGAESLKQHNVMYYKYAIWTCIFSIVFTLLAGGGGVAAHPVLVLRGAVPVARAQLMDVHRGGPVHPGHRAGQPVAHQVAVPPCWPCRDVGGTCCPGRRAEHRLHVDGDVLLW